MATTLRATFDGHVFVPDQPVELDIGQKVDVLIGDESSKPTVRPRQTLGEFLAQFPIDFESPQDAAAQHDHYLYGTPKRENP